MLRRRLRSFWLATAGFAVLLSSIGALLAPATTTRADVGDMPHFPYNAKVYRELSANQHYYWLYGCLRNASLDIKGGFLGNKLSADEVDSWDFFTEADDWNITLGAMYDKSSADNWYRKCKDENMVKTAFGMFGFKSARDTFCSMPGSKFDGDNDLEICKAGKGEKFTNDSGVGASTSTLADWFAREAKNRTPRPAMKNEHYYMRGYASLVQGCDISFSDKTYKTAAEVPTGTGATTKRYAVAIVEEGKAGKAVVRYKLGTGKEHSTIVDIVATTGFTIASSTDSGVPVGYGPKSTMTCKDLAESTQKNAADYAKLIQKEGTDAPPVGDGDGGGGDDDKTSCAIKGIGWVVCPAALFLAELNDGLFGGIRSFMEIPASIFQSGGDTYRIWQQVRNIANVFFVVAFLIIIYSQVTGAGVTNYGIKKLLPKLFIAAVLVNASFWICAIAIDLSNIIGASIYGVMQGFMDGVYSGGKGSPVTSWSDVTAWIIAGGAGVFASGVTLAALGTSGFMGAIAGLVPSILLALLAFLTAFVLLIAREAFIIILVIIAPLAFVAYLLPNTEDWFKRWRKFFVALLIMYPSVGLLFGGSSLAAAIIRAADPTNAWLVIGSLVVTALPLFALPALMKASSGMMNRIGGVVGNPNRSMFNKMRERAKQYQEDQRNFNKGAALQGQRRWGRRTFRREADRESRKEAAEAEAAHGLTHYRGLEDENGNPANRAAAYQRRAIDARESEKLKGQILADTVKVQHLELNPQLHTDATHAGLDLHNAETAHKNDATRSHIQNNQGQYNQLYGSEDKLKVAQQNSKNAYGVTGEGRTNAQDIKVAEKTGQNIAQQHENTYLASNAGKKQSQASKKLTDENKTLEGNLESAYLETKEGANARRKSVVAQKDSGDKGKIIEQQGETIYLNSADGQRQQTTLTVGTENLASLNADIKAAALETAAGQAAVGARVTSEQRVTNATKRAEDTVKATDAFKDLAADGIVLDKSIAASMDEAKAIAFTSPEGVAAATRAATAEKQAKTAVRRAEATFDTNDDYVQASKEAAAAKQAAKASESRVDAQVEEDPDYRAAKTEAATEEQNLKAATAEADTVTKSNPNYIDAAIGAATAEQQTKAAESGVDAAIKDNGGYQAAATQAATADQRAKRAETAAETETKKDDDYQAAAIETDVAKQDLSVAESELEERTIEENASEHIAAQAAKDSAANATARHETYVDELRTEEGAQAHEVDKESPEFQATVENLQQAATQKSALSQRRSSAATVANREYAKKVQDGTTIPTPSGPQTVAEVAGGIDEHGEVKAKGAAKQTLLDDVRKTIGAIKSLNSETPNEDILDSLDDAAFNDLSTEEIAAKAGLVASRHHRESQIKLQKKLYDQQKRIDNMPPGDEKDRLKAKLVDVVQQVSSDRSGYAFGIGDREKGKNEIGRIEENIYKSTRDRILTNISAESLSSMDPDDLALIYEMHQANLLSPEQKDKIAVEYKKWQKSAYLQGKLKDKQRVFLDRMVDVDGTIGNSEYLGQPAPKPKYGLTADSFK